MSATRKIYIDSRQGQGTGSDFTLTLKQSVQCPENTIAFIDEIIVPNTFLPVDQNRCYSYMRETFQSVVTDRRIQLDVGELCWPRSGSQPSRPVEERIYDNRRSVPRDL